MRMESVEFEGFRKMARNFQILFFDCTNGKESGRNQRYENLDRRPDLPTRKADWSATRRRKIYRTLNLGVVHGHARQLRALLERLDVACGVAVASTNGERSMRPRGREVEKSVGSAQCAIKRIRVFSGAKDTKNGITQEKWTENSSGKADWTAI